MRLRFAFLSVLDERVVTCAMDDNSRQSAKRRARLISTGMQVLKIRKSKNLSLGLKMPSDLPSGEAKKKDNATRKASATKRKKWNGAHEEEQRRKEQRALVEERFHGLQEKSIVEIRRTRDNIATQSSPTKLLKVNVANPRSAMSVMNWFDTKSDGLKAANPQSILNVLEEGLDKQKKKFDRLVILGNKKKAQIAETELQLQKQELLSNKGEEKNNFLLKKVSELKTQLEKSLEVADEAERYNYVLMLLANRAKKPSDDIKTEIVKMQKEVKAVEREIQANTKLAHRRRSSAIKVVGKANALEKQLNDIRIIYDNKRKELLHAKNGTKQLQVRLKIRNEARDKLVRFLNGDHGEEEEQKLLDDVMKGEMKMKELEERQKELIESGKAIEDAFFNMQQLSRANSLDECVYNFIHREDKYKKMLKQEKRMLHLLEVLREQNKELKEEDAKAQFAMDNIDVKRDIMVNRERLEEEAQQIQMKIDSVNKHSNDLYLQLQFTSQCLVSISKLLGEISPRMTKQKGILDMSQKLSLQQESLDLAISAAPDAAIKEESARTKDVIDPNADGTDVIEDSNTKFPFPPSPINANHKRRKASFSRSRSVSAALPYTNRRRSSSDVSNPDIGRSGNKEIERKGSLGGKLQSPTSNGNKIPADRSNPNTNPEMIPRPPQTQTNPFKNPSKKTKRTRQKLNPINIDKFDQRVYDLYVKDIVRKLNNFLSEDLLESKEDSFSSIAGSLYDAMREHEGAVVPARPGNIRVASLHPKRRRQAVQNVYNLKAIADLHDDLKEAINNTPASPILNDSEFDDGNSPGNEEDMKMDEERRSFKIATYHVLKSHNHHLAAAHFHHARLGSPQKGTKTPSPAGKHTRRKTTRKHSRIRTDSTASQEENNNIASGFRQSAGIQEFLGHLNTGSSKKSKKRSSTIKRRKTTKGSTFVTQLPPPGYRTGGISSAAKKKLANTNARGSKTRRGKIR